jgi:hypothetical protein
MSSKKSKGKVKKNGPNSQAKLKYINSCIVSMIDGLPRQTFSQMPPVFFEVRESFTEIPVKSKETEQSVQKPSKRRKPNPKKQDKDAKQLSLDVFVTPTLSNSISSDTPIVISSPILSDIPRHPNVHFICAFCKARIPSQILQTYLEHPHSRRRFTPICNRCVVEQ